MASFAVSGPTEIAMTSPFILSRSLSASSTANSSYGLRMNFTPAGSIDFVSPPTLMRVVVSGTWLTQTAMVIVWEYRVLSSEYAGVQVHSVLRTRYRSEERRVGKEC